MRALPNARNKGTDINNQLTLDYKFLYTGPGITAIDHNLIKSLNMELFLEKFNLGSH